MKQLFGLLVALLIAMPSFASNAPHFTALSCDAGATHLQIQFETNDQGARIAMIEMDEETIIGFWQWTPSQQGTRLSGYYHLDFNGSPAVPFQLSTLVSPQGKPSGGWLNTEKFSAPMECQITPLAKHQDLCKVAPQNNCSKSPKRLCCVCESGGVSCS